MEVLLWMFTVTLVSHKTVSAGVEDSCPECCDMITVRANTIRNVRLMPSVGNGHLAVQMLNPCLRMNGLYNHFRYRTHRACIPSPALWRVSSVQVSRTGLVELSWTYQLNSSNGIFKEIGEDAKGTIRVELATFASRDRHSLLVRQLKVTLMKNFNSSDKVVVFTEGAWPYPISDDATLKITAKNNTHFTIRGRTNFGETGPQDIRPVCIVGHSVKSQYEFSRRTSGRPLNILTAVHFSCAAASRDLRYGEAQSPEFLEHNQAANWQQLWRNGSINIQYPGKNKFLCTVIHTAQYYLLSSLPWPLWPYSDGVAYNVFCGLSPGGLPHGGEANDYMGHVFWDQETWMLPAFLLTHPELVKRMLLYRKLTLPKAKKYAKNGARYAWESAQTGEDVAPYRAVRDQEIHITGDISLAIQQYLFTLATSDTEFYWSVARNILEEIAIFWLNRVILNNTTGLYEIHNVMPPDEYHFRINNSAYTNSVAAISLKGPLRFAIYFHLDVPEEYKSWAAVADKIYMPRNASRNLTLEYDGYKFGTVVKQADVILLNYPLGVEMERHVLRNDLEYYENVTDLSGPAMTWSMFAVNWLDLGETTKAYQLFKRSFEYVHMPFYVWTEERPGTGAVNFLTGMGGFLQSVLYGSVGLRVHFNALQIRPQLPAEVTRVQVQSVHYRGAVFDLLVGHNESVQMSLLHLEPITALNGGLTVTRMLNGDSVCTLTRNSPHCSLPLTQGDSLWVQTK